MDINLRIKDNGKPTISIHKKGSYYVGSMKVTDRNIFIIESKNNSNPQSRKFILSIRQNNNKEYKLTQFNCDLDELIKIRDSIDEIINFK